MVQSNRSQQDNVDVYDIISAGTVSAIIDRSQRPLDVLQQQRENPLNDDSSSAERQRNRQSRNRFKISSSSRKKIGNFSCMYGIIGTFVGAGLVLIFVLAEYAPSLNDVVYSQALIIPGFILLFSGIVALLVGIYFCWVRSKGRRRRYTTRRDEIEAGFGISRRSSRLYGYTNPSMVPDNPPSYGDVTGIYNATSLDSQAADDEEKLPSYRDVVKQVTRSNMKKDTAEHLPPEQPPPPYSNNGPSLPVA